jgi:hypothetical protein
MVIHKNTKATPVIKQQIRDDYCNGMRKKQLLCEKYRLSRPTIDKILADMRKWFKYPKPSINHRFRALEYGMKRLAKIETTIVKKKNAEARRYSKEYPWELFHMDTKKLPAIAWDVDKSKEYIFVWIDHYSAEWYAVIKGDKTQESAREVLIQFVNECPYEIEKILTDNGKEYKWTESHEFVMTCEQYSITQAFTKVKRPQTNGKAERFIRTLIEMWHEKEKFTSREERKQSLKRFINWYNTVKPHKWIENKTPYEYLYEFYYWNSTEK